MAIVGSTRSALRVVALAAGAASHARGQSLLQEWQGQPALTQTARFGAALDLFRDLDGDGVRDLLVGAPDEDRAKARRRDGVVYVISGATGAVIRTHLGGPTDELGSDVALCVLGDLDGDGRRDLGVSATSTTSSKVHYLKILSSATGATIRDWSTMRSSVVPVRSACRLDDRTGDGIDEFAVGYDSSFGTVEIVDGASFATIGFLDGELGVGDTFGDHCGQAGDLDGDGVRELVVSDQSFGWSTQPDGHVYVYSGATLAELLSIDNPEPGVVIGYGVVFDSSDFDFNGDGVPDLAVGRVGPAPLWQFPPTGVDVWSGKNGRLLCSIPSMTAGDEGLGCALQFHDWNGDGFDDVIAGAFWNAAPPMSSGMVHVFSGNDLFLQMGQPAWYRYWPGDPIEARTLGGEPNELSLLALVDVDGSPTFAPLALVALDGFGESALADVVPPGLGGTTMTFQAFATRPARHGLAVSDRAVVQFQ